MSFDTKAVFKEDRKSLASSFIHDFFNVSDEKKVLRELCNLELSKNLFIG